MLTGSRKTRINRKLGKRELRLYFHCSQDERLGWYLASLRDGTCAQVEQFKRKSFMLKMLSGNHSTTKSLILALLEKNSHLGYDYKENILRHKSKSSTVLKPWNVRSCQIYKFKLCTYRELLLLVPVEFVQVLHRNELLGSCTVYLFAGLPQEWWS